MGVAWAAGRRGICVEHKLEEAKLAKQFSYDTIMAEKGTNNVIGWY
jgi:hypothetical protein